MEFSRVAEERVENTSGEVVVMVWLRRVARSLVRSFASDLARRRKQSREPRRPIPLAVA
jgi:hypothetical protein